MKCGVRAQGRNGFALILVITLLGLLVLCVVSLGALVRVNGEISVAATRHAGARQHALLGLRLALSELQRQAGEDERVTGMAGVSGVPTGGGHLTRHWCGVWQANGRFETWLASGAAGGAAAALEPGIEAIPLVAAGSVGASSFESEHVVAGRVAIPFPAEEGAASAGAYAFVVLDEGVKISAYSPADRLASADAVPQLSAVSGAAQKRLESALTTHASRLDDVLSYEQLSVLPAPAAPVLKSTLHDNFHHVTLTALTVGDALCRSGMININTTSRHVWAGVLETYNDVPGVKRVPAERVAEIGERIAAEFAAETSGKMGEGPFTNVAALGASTLLTRNLPPSVTAAQVVAALQPMLAVRSDTFRIRAYGDAGAAGGSSDARARAWCEAIVQRTSRPAPAGGGRAFRVVYFRWLGPDDV